MSKEVSPTRSRVDSQADGQVGGDHYKKFPMDPITFSERCDLTPMEFSVIKYITRHRLKNGSEDVLKALHYCTMILREHYDVECTITTKDKGIPSSQQGDR